ncbi:protein kinase [Pendulispora rubella]|uniref:Protein kinase n=1 Tax=Pendulispora rubella TaxID=2741070 RepID=A0ABZ2KWM8_9BACT
MKTPPLPAPEDSGAPAPLSGGPAPSVQDVGRPAMVGRAAASDPAASGLPQRFGKYTLLRKLATGGMAELFLALQRSVAGFEKLVVIKRILPRVQQDRAFIEMLLHEARVAATLSHPNVVQIFDVGQIDGTYFIAMEHVHGEDIRSIARQMKRKTLPGYTELPLEHALSVMLGVCAGLAYAHEKRDFDGTALNIVHRDISPQNVVVTFSGDIKIVDFGIAKSDRGLRSDTRSGKLKGKVPYMSPEQARGEDIDARSDIFSAGVMLFELTTGRRLFKSSSEYETLKLICERDYPSPSDVVPDYPAELEAIVMRALARNREERFRTAREMQAALEDFVRREQMIVSPIGLQHFMHSLFADKLVSQKEALLQGKQLAEAIDLRQADTGQAGGDLPASEKEYFGAHLSAPAASHTVTNAIPPSGRMLPWAFAGVVTLALVVVSGTTFFAKGTRPAEATASLSHLSASANVPQNAAPATTDEAVQAREAPTPAPGLSPAEAPVPFRTAQDPLAAASPKANLEGAAAARVNAPGKLGKLNVAAAGGWCDVSVDGKSFGPTPVASIELSAGFHRVTCTPAEGKAQSANVRVPPAGTARHRFLL